MSDKNKEDTELQQQIEELDKQLTEYFKNKETKDNE
jgi:hypothetical protein